MRRKIRKRKPLTDRIGDGSFDFGDDATSFKTWLLESSGELEREKQRSERTILIEKRSLKFE